MTIARDSIGQFQHGQSDSLPEAIFASPAWYLEHSLWIADAMSPGNAAHNYPLAMRIRGPLNQKALAHGLQEIMRRHRVLRSAFRIEDGKPAQRIMPVQPLSMPLLDLSGFPEDVREAKAQEAVFEDVRRPFDLTRGPMLRPLLVRLQPEEHILLLTTHHVACDYWSTRILIRDLFALYAAFSASDHPPLSQPGFEYADYVQWLETRLQAKGPELMGFWRERIAGKDFHHLAVDHEAPIPRSYRGACERAIFPEELIDSIKQLSVRERLSPFMIMLAGLQCLVQRYSGHEEIGIGSCVANRPLPQLENVIGPFANVTILRTDLSGNPTCRQVFRQVREVCLTAFNYQDVPFGHLVHKLQPRFDPARHPIFQILFVLLNAPSDPVETPGLTIEPIPVDTGTSCFEMNMNVRMHKWFEIDLQYSSDLFEAATIRDFLQDYRAVLESLCANPEARIAELAIKSKHAEMNAVRQLEYPGTEYVPASGAVESQLVQLWESVLDKRRVGVNDNFFEIGGDSLRAARLFARIQETFHRSVPLGTLFHSPTVATLAKVISEAGSTSKCLVTIQHGSSRPPLFCVHGQSGSLLMYRGLAQHLGADQLVYGVQPPELENKRPLFASIEDMASAYVREVELIQGDGPYFLTGYCMGGTIAFEMAQQLHRRGRNVGLVALLDTYNWIRTPTSKSEDLYFTFQTSWFGLRHFLFLGPQDKRKYLRRRYEELWDEETEISEHNKRAAMRYVPKVYEGRILQVRPTRQLSRYKRPELSLDGLAAHGVEEFWLRGYPGQILEEPLVRDLAAKLKACMSECASGQSSNHPFPTRIMAA
jgi:thioesterase domain-containing protein/acyl carrier protein